MAIITLPRVLFALALSRLAHAAVYTLSDAYVGESFLTGFQHQNIPDPTHGRGYVDPLHSHLRDAHTLILKRIRGPRDCTCRKLDFRHPGHAHHARGLILSPVPERSREEDGADP